MPHITKYFRFRIIFQFFIRWNIRCILCKFNIIYNLMLLTILYSRLGLSNYFFLSEPFYTIADKICRTIFIESCNCHTFIQFNCFIFAVFSINFLWRIACSCPLCIYIMRIFIFCRRTIYCLCFNLCFNIGRFIYKWSILPFCIF